MIIVKIGGGKEVNQDYVLTDFVKLKEEKILVHGAAETANEIAGQLGHPPKMVTSVSGFESRLTDQTTMDILMMVYAGLVNKRIVEKLQSLGLNAVGLSGLDGRLWEGKRKDTIKIVEKGKKKVIRGDYTGKVEKVNVSLLKLLISNGYVPVITIPGISYESEAINLDNDRALAVMAGQLAADKIISLFTAPGLLKDAGNENSLVKEIPKKEIESFYGFAQGRMKKKLMGAKEAIALGVKEIYFGDGRVEEPITKALRGEGTVIR